MDILWFRNDLRVIDNPALLYARQQGVSKALFFITEQQWQQHDMAAIKVDFMLRHVALLQAQLEQIGICLEVVEAIDFNAQVDYFNTLAKRLKGEGQPLRLFANQEVELNEQRRDQQIIASGVELRLFEADVVVAKGSVVTNQGHMYKVFTPFKRAWLKHVAERGFEFIVESADGIRAVDSNTLAKIPHNYPSADSRAWPLADYVQQRVIATFIQDKIDDYDDLRDFPSVKATSGLSPYLAIGAISPRYLLHLLLNQNPDLLTTQRGGMFTWLTELIWREFYRHLLHHFPRLCMGVNFQEKYEHLVWENNADNLQAWQQGRTGYPLVDAAMRQLNNTGWMHNRLRMVVASFLTKHLLIDWRYGEQYFAKHLIDWDLAANNGGWQWAASTGCDAQPYFRIFNPISQSEKFDPDGKFIRKYLPELDKVPDKHIHFPHEYIEQHNLECYWPAIVDHKQARLRALAFYKHTG
ncbi:deoxyribodipyrimidine photo-lyase [Thalassotalea maritima]|uniref:deoxyribodipyrimidine photo-lyase n=1 Tax=Thalassotalea maritima TaxID=3242416 RepID=UPI0035299D90